MNGICDVPTESSEHLLPSTDLQIQLSVYMALEQKQVLHESALCYVLSYSTMRIGEFSILT